MKTFLNSRKYYLWKQIFEKQGMFEKNKLCFWCFIRSTFWVPTRSRQYLSCPGFWGQDKYFLSLGQDRTEILIFQSPPDRTENNETCPSRVSNETERVTGFREMERNATPFLRNQAFRFYFFFKILDLYFYKYL